MANIITELHLEMSDNWYVTKKLNSVGRVGENTVTKLIIEPTEILDNVTYEIEIADASGSKNVAELTIDGTELYLILTANMLTTSGIMKMQVRGLFTDGSIKKSNIFELKVNRSISATEHYEEYAVTIFDQLVAECRDIIEGAESYAIRAETAAVNAEAYSEVASASADTASAAATTASTASTAAVNAAASAETSANTASASAETASTAAASASTSASTATSASETAQAASVTASTSAETAVNASNTATSAASNAETSATTATTAANNASASATAASTSASNAATSETNASTSAANAHTSETNAANSAASASTSAANASTSATNAANSATSAATSATNAHNSEVNASTSETNASASATEAAASAESIAASVAQINENTYRINDLEAIIGGYQLTDLPTGEIATITDGTALLMPSLKVGIEPVQDLHGYDHPWAGGAGKNLFDKAQTFIKDKYIDVNGDIQNTTYGWEISDYIPLKNNTNYYISGNNVTGASAYNALYDSDKNLVRTFGYLSGNHNGAFTTDVNEFYIRICTQDSVINNVQVEEGSTATSYEPYSNICPISGWTAANVTRTGKNLCKMFADGYVPSINGGILVPASDSRSDFIPIVPNTRYTFSANVSSLTMYTFYYDKDKNFLSYQNGSGIISYDSPANSAFAMLRAGVPQVSNFDFQFEKGVRTTYEPYNGTTYNIQFTDGDNPLTVYGGTLDVTTGELVVDRVMVDLGTLNYSYYSGNLFTALITNLKPVPNSRLCNALCSIYVAEQGNRYASIDGSFVAGFNNAPTLAIHDSRFTDATDFKTAMNGVQLVYELATPLTYHLTPTQVRTLVGNNNIRADTGDIIEGKYFKSLV